MGLLGSTYKTCVFLSSLLFFLFFVILAFTLWHHAWYYDNALHQTDTSYLHWDFCTGKAVVNANCYYWVSVFNGLSTKG